MTWLTWRQYRFQLYVAAALLAAFAVVILITGRQMPPAPRQRRRLRRGPSLQDVAGGGLFMGSHVVGFLVIATLSAPLLFGLFWGAPLVASELDAGTAQFAWMQSITRDPLARDQGRLAAARRGGLGRRHLGPGDLVVQPGRRAGPEPVRPRPLRPRGPRPGGIRGVRHGARHRVGTLLRGTLPAMAGTLSRVRRGVGDRVLWVRAHDLSAVTVTDNALGSDAPARLALATPVGVVGPNGQPLPQPNNMTISTTIRENYLPGSARPARLGCQ